MISTQLHATDAIPELLFDIENAVISEFHISREELLSPRRTKRNTQARFAAWFIANKHFAFPYLELALYYGKHHSTIIYGVRQVGSSPLKSRAEKVAERLIPSTNSNSNRF